MRFGQTPAEYVLLARLISGEFVDFRAGDPKTDIPSNADNWKEDRTIRAELLYWLCVDDAANKLVHAKGVQIRGALINGVLDFESVELSHRLGLLECAIPFGIILRHAVTRSLQFSGSHTGRICADSLRMRGTLFMRDAFQSKGGVVLRGAKIGGDLDCGGAALYNIDGVALDASGISVSESVYLTMGFLAKGEVCFRGSDIGGNLECDGARLDNPKGAALDARSLAVRGSVFLRDGFQSDGEILLSGAKIQEYLDFGNATLGSAGSSAMTAQFLCVEGVLNLSELKSQPTGAIDLLHARVGQLADDERSWPRRGSLELDGFEYRAFVGGSPRTSVDRLRWLQLQPSTPFRPRPYEQLAKVFREMGEEVEARTVLTAKQEAMLKYGQLSRTTKAWRWFLGKTIRYGYEPWRVVYFMVGMLLFGWLLFWYSGNHGWMRLAEKSGPEFNPFVYSLELFVPLVDLHHVKYWLPNDYTPYSGWLWTYLWWHISLGWVSSTLLVASFTGLIRKE